MLRESFVLKQSLLNLQQKGKEETKEKKFAEENKDEDSEEELSDELSENDEFKYQNLFDHIGIKFYNMRLWIFVDFEQEKYYSLVSEEIPSDYKDEAAEVFIFNHASNFDPSYEAVVTYAKNGNARP